MKGHIYHMLYKSILREKVRQERLNRGVFHATNDRLFFATRSEGGVWHDSGSRCGNDKLIYLTHYIVVITYYSASRVPNGRKRRGRERPPPQKAGGHAVPKRGALWHPSFRPHDWSLSSSFIPAGRLGTAPLSPRASLCRIGPRRQGSASPLRALDGSGPIRGATLFTKGKGGGGPCGARASR